MKIRTVEITSPRVYQSSTSGVNKRRTVNDALIIQYTSFLPNYKITFYSIQSSSTRGIFLLAHPSRS